VSRDALTLLTDALAGKMVVKDDNDFETGPIRKDRLAFSLDHLLGRAGEI